MKSYEINLNGRIWTLSLLCVLLMANFANAATSSGEVIERGRLKLEALAPAFYGDPIYLNPDQDYKKQIENKLNDAIGDLHLGYSLDAKNAEINCLLGKAYSFAHDLDVRGAWQKSTAYLETCLDVNPKNVGAHFYLGKNYMDAEQYTKALKLYEKAYELDPDSEAEKFISHALMLQNRAEEAKIAMRSYVVKHPNDHIAKKTLVAMEDGKFSKEVLHNDGKEKMTQDLQSPVIQIKSSPGKITTQEDLKQWITYYYLHKDSTLVVPGIRYIMESKILEKGDTGAPILSFLGSVFKQNEDKIEGWVRELDYLGIKEKEWLWIAVAWSDTTKGLDLLERLQNEYEGEPNEFLKKRVENEQYDALVDPIKQPFHLDVMWGNFSATGDERYVKRVIDVLPWFQPGAEAEKAMIGASARWSLTSNAVQHPKIMEICKQVSVIAAEPLKSILNDLIKNAEEKLAEKITGRRPAGKGNE